jgi:hypothetical protein
MGLTNHRIRRLPQARLVRSTSRAIVNADHFNVRQKRKMRYGHVVGVLWLTAGLALIALVVFGPVGPGERTFRRFYLVGYSCIALGWGISRLRVRRRDDDRGTSREKMPNQSPDPAPGSVTPAAEQPPRQP